MASNQSVLNALRICELRMSVRGILCYLAITLDSAETALKYYLRQGSEYEVILLSCRNISLWFAAILLDASTRNSLWELKCPAADDSYKFQFLPRAEEDFVLLWVDCIFPWVNFIWPWRFILLLICFVWSSVEIWFARLFHFCRCTCGPPYLPQFAQLRRQFAIMKRLFFLHSPFWAQLIQWGYLLIQLSASEIL